ncbi:MAG: type II secretion system F family protein [Oscillospiraceae bacterium]|nr:type II secretion system F family protein [Oscillospiraceae bacterium]
MALYSYVATDLAGKVKKGTETAENNQQLVDRLRERELFVTKVEEVQHQSKNFVNYRFKTAKLSIFCRQLSAMLFSGINLVRALHILMLQEEDKRAKKILLEIYEELQRGKSFTEALEMQEGAFPDLFVGMMAAGEISGNLDMIVDRVADHYAKENKLMNTVKKSLTYPIILGVLMVVIVIGLFVFVLPMFIGMYPEGQDLPGLSAVMMGISDFLTTRWYVVAIIVFVIAVGIRALLRIPSVRLQIDKAKCEMPKIGKLVRTIYTARFGRTMANLFSSGMQMVECIEKSVGTLNNKYLLMRFDDVIEDVKRGEPLSGAIAKLNVFDGMFTSTIYIGEESGRLDEILSKSADFYDEESETALAKLTSMIEPLMIVFMGAAVALVLASIFPLMYGSFEGLADG